MERGSDNKDIQQQQQQQQQQQLEDTAAAAAANGHNQKNTNDDKHEIDDEDDDVDEPWIEAQGGLYDNQKSNSSFISKEVDDGDDDQIDEEDDDDVECWGMNHQLFADPDPIQDFHLQWQQPIIQNPFEMGDHDDSVANTTKTTTTTTRTISIDLRGHKPENGQTLSSTGLTLWRGSELLCDYLLQHAPELFHSSSSSTTQHESNHDRRAAAANGITVLELGAGLGVCGILAHRLGAAHVVMTDGDSETLQWLRANVQRNSLSSSSDHENDDSPSSTATSTITCAQLQWGLNLERFQQRHGIYDYDVIMASDIIYVEEILHPLWKTVQTLLSPRRGSKFCLSFVRRNVSWDLVLAVAAAYEMELIEIPSLPLSGEEGHDHLEKTERRQSSETEEIVDLTAATPRDGVFVFQRKQ